MPKITKRLIEAAMPGKKEILIWDSELKGFHCKITPKGKKVYKLYYRTKEGKQRKPTIGTHGKITCDKARGKALQWLSDVEYGNDPSLNKNIEKFDITIIELAEKYKKEYAEVYKKAKSVKEDGLLLKNHIIPAFSKINITMLTYEDISKLHYNLRAKPTTANRCLALLSKMLNLAEKWGMIKDAGALCKHIDKYPEKRREKFLSNAEIERLFTVLKEAECTQTESSSVISAIKLLLLTGCRLSEIITLKWEYINIEHSRINFPDSKTGKKTIYISPYVVEILDSIKKQGNNPYVIYGIKEDAHLVNLQKAWDRIRRKAGLEDVRLHDLRHSFASIGAANGLSLPIIGALLGHNHVQTTARYAHLIGDPLRDAANLIGEKIKAIADKGTIHGG